MKFKPIVPDTVFGPDQKKMQDLANELETLYQESASADPVRLLELENVIVVKETAFNQLLPKDFHHQSFKIKIERKIS